MLSLLSCCQLVLIEQNLEILENPLTEWWGEVSPPPNKQEFKLWKKESIAESSDGQGLRYAQFCFTEQGVTMLSCVLNSKRPR